MAEERGSFSNLLQQSIEQEISRLQEHPESVVAAFDANERVAQELGLADNLHAVSTFLTKRLGIETSVIHDNYRPEIKDPGSMMTRVQGDRPEYVLELTWMFEERERRFKLIVGRNGEEVRILVGNDHAEVVDTHNDYLLNYKEVHERIKKLLFSQINSDFSVARSIPSEEEPAPTPA